MTKKKNKTVLVCGGRKYALHSEDEAERLFSVLHYINDTQGIEKIVHGGAKGADEAADLWAYVNNIPVTSYPANWSKFGKSAGHRRNAEMLDKEDIDLVVAFPGGAGTSDMVHKALANNIKVTRVEK